MRKDFPPVKKFSPSPSSFTSSLQITTTLERKESPDSRHGSFASPHIVCSILTSWYTSESKKSPVARFYLSWDAGFYYEIRLKILMCKRGLHSLKKLGTKETSICMKSIFNAPSKIVSLKDKLSLKNFKKNDPVSCTSTGLYSYEKIHDSTFIKFAKHCSSSHATTCF